MRYIGDLAVKRIGLVLCLTLLTAVGCGKKQLEKVRNMEIRDVDLSQIADGEYTGEYIYFVGPWGSTNTVVVTVKDHLITEVEIMDTSDTDIARKARGIADRILNAQSPNVEGVSGATITGKALMKATENALMKGINATNSVE